MGGNRLLQSNINHAQDLLYQTMAERGVDIAVMAEPYRVPPNNGRWASETSLPCTFLEAGEGYATVRWGRWMVVGVYLPPRLNITEYEGRLDDIQECVNRHPWPALVAGDFNAHNKMWRSSATNNRGKAVENWAARTGLI